MRARVTLVALAVAAILGAGCGSEDMVTIPTTPTEDLSRFEGTWVRDSVEGRAVPYRLGTWALGRSELLLTSVSAGRQGFFTLHDSLVDPSGRASVMAIGGAVQWSTLGDTLVVRPTQSGTGLDLTGVRFTLVRGMLRRQDRHEVYRR